MRVWETNCVSRFLVYSPMWGRSHVTFMGKLADVLVEEGHDVVSLFPLSLRLSIWLQIPHSFPLAISPLQTLVGPIFEAHLGTHGTKLAKARWFDNRNHENIRCRWSKFPHASRCWTIRGTKQRNTWLMCGERNQPLDSLVYEFCFWTWTIPIFRRSTKWKTRGLVNVMVRVRRSPKLSLFVPATLSHPGLIEHLKEEKFDAAFYELMDLCGPGRKFGFGNALNILFKLYSISRALTNSR